MLFQKVQNQYHVCLTYLILVTFLFSGFIFNSSSIFAADETVPGVKESIRKGVEYLSKRASADPEGYYGLAAYTLLKADVKPTDPTVELLITKIIRKIQSGEYTPDSDRHRLYEASVDLMALEAADPVANKEFILVIAQYIASYQKDYGGWYYVHRGGQGDTSITQYAVLALWAAHRAGIKIKKSVWAGVAKFHLQTQRPDGGFAYHPAESMEVSMNMTVAGVANLLLARKFLYPNSKGYNSPDSIAVSVEKKVKETVKKEENKKEDEDENLPRLTLPEAVKELIKREIILPQFSIEKDEQERLQEEKEKAEKEKAANAKKGQQEKSTPRRTSMRNIDSAISKGLDWISKNYPTTKRHYEYYFQYSIERMCALAGLNQIAKVDWYEHGAKKIMARQLNSGDWVGSSKHTASTSFALLFLLRATKKLLKGGPGNSGTIGNGILAGGRGLPDNLSDVQNQKGEVKKEKMSGPLNDLLSALENPDSLKVEAVQNTIIEKFQIGDREELIGQIDRLLELLDDPRAEVRRTILWALGRTGDMRVVPKVIKSLNDNDLDVIVEARNALCWISHRPNGFEMPSHPLEGHEGVQDDAKKEEIIKKWKEDANLKWTRWYRKVRPYKERDDLEENSDPIKTK